MPINLQQLNPILNQVNSQMQRIGASRFDILERGVIYKPIIDSKGYFQHHPIAFSPQLFNDGKSQIHNYDQFGYLISAIPIITLKDSNFPKQELPSITDLDYYFHQTQASSAFKSSPTIYSFNNGINHYHILPNNYITKPLYEQVLQYQPIISYL
ncbi:MAG: hypothetical protein ACO201_00230 [Rickettsiales bacterium]